MIPFSQVLSMECESEPDRPLTQWPESWPPPSADHDNRTRQRIRASLCKHGGDWGIVLAGKQSEAGEIGTVNGASHLSLTLGALRVEVNYYK